MTGAGSGLVLITGAPGAGKTTALRLALASFAEAGLAVRACLSEATERLPEGPALGFDLVLYETGFVRGSRPVQIARAALARRPPPLPGNGPQRERMVPFIFSSEAFSDAAAFLAGDPALPAAVAVDEIGPLELEDGGGFRPALDAWRRGAVSRLLIATVRPSLVRTLAELLDPADCRIVAVDGVPALAAAGTIAAHVDALRQGGLGWRP